MGASSGKLRTAATLVVGLTLAPLALMAAANAQQLRGPVPFTAAQAAQGKAAYADSCAGCHGDELQGEGPAAALVGPAFLDRYGGEPIEEVMTAIRRMPPGAADSLDVTTQVSILAFLLQANGGTPGPVELSSAEEGRAGMILRGPAGAGGGRGGPGGGEGRIVNVTPKPGPSRLDNIRPVTEAELDNPSPNDWLNWRRTRDAMGFSPLKQINRGNVKNLQAVWSYGLPPGANMMAPIVRDGVLFAYSAGDVVEALDATNGELLWRHQRRLDEGRRHTGKKGVAIAGDKIIVPTSDAHILALNIKTGAVVWDLKIDTNGQTGSQIKSAPLIVGNKAIIGLNGYADVKGGSFLLAVDLNTGRELWRFNTVAQPGEPGGNTWNDLAQDRRSGGSVWEAATYDPKLNLIYFGAAPTYDTGPLRRNLNRPGISNDALYTNSTIALNPDTGKLVWYFQHQPNDQLDLDWIFERQVLDIKVNGAKRRVVITAGKHAIYEVMDAATGEYLFSMDLGLQNVIIAIDPKTGAKTLNPASIPAPSASLARFAMPGICPDTLGARNMMSASFSPATGLLHLPTTDTCFRNPNRTRWQKTPTPANANEFGILQAIDLDTRKVVWTKSQFAPPVSGNLVTGGGLLFTGDVNRWFRALDERNGRELWKVRLEGEPESYPVTYSVNGKQYVAVATNEGWVHVEAMRLAAGVARQPHPRATLWVFALPD